MCALASALGAQGGKAQQKKKKKKKWRWLFCYSVDFFSGVPHQVYVEGTCCQIEQQAAGEFSPGPHVSGGAVGK